MDAQEVIANWSDIEDESESNESENEESEDDSDEECEDMNDATRDVWRQTTGK